MDLSALCRVNGTRDEICGGERYVGARPEACGEHGDLEVLEALERSLAARSALFPDVDVALCRDGEVERLPSRDRDAPLVAPKKASRECVCIRFLVFQRGLGSQRARHADAARDGDVSRLAKRHLAALKD